MAIPIWIACRSDQSSEIGHVWQCLYKFTRIAIPPLSTAETQRLIAGTIAAGNIQSDAGRHLRELHRLSAGDSRKLEEQRIEYSTRHYRRKSFGLDLLALDRSIHELDAALRTAVEQNT